MPCWDLHEGQQTGGGTEILKSQRVSYLADCQWVVAVGPLTPMHRPLQDVAMRPALPTDEAHVAHWRGPRWVPRRPPLVSNEVSVALQTGAEKGSVSSPFCLQAPWPAPEQPFASPLFFMNYQDFFLGRMDGWTNGRMDGWTDGRMDGWTNGRLDG